MWCVHNVAAYLMPIPLTSAVQQNIFILVTINWSKHQIYANVLLSNRSEFCLAWTFHDLHGIDDKTFSKTRLLSLAATMNSSWTEMHVSTFLNYVIWLLRHRISMKLIVSHRVHCTLTDCCARRTPPKIVLNVCSFVRSFMQIQTLSLCITSCKFIKINQT